MNLDVSNISLHAGWSSPNGRSQRRDRYLHPKTLKTIIERQAHWAERDSRSTATPGEVSNPDLHGQIRRKSRRLPARYHCIGTCQSLSDHTRASTRSHPMRLAPFVCNERHALSNARHFNPKPPLPNEPKTLFLCNRFPKSIRPAISTSPRSIPAPARRGRTACVPNEPKTTFHCNKFRQNELEIEPEAPNGRTLPVWSGRNTEPRPTPPPPEL